MTGAHERWLFSTLFIGAKRVLSGTGAPSRTAESEPAGEASADAFLADEDPESGVRSREEVLASPLAPRKRTKTG
jgi:hypothetical protein